MVWGVQAKGDLTSSHTRGTCAHAQIRMLAEPAIACARGCFGCKSHDFRWDGVTYFLKS